MPPSQIIDDWLAWLTTSKGRAKLTVEKYGHAVRNFFEWCKQENVQPFYVTAKQLDKYTGRHLHNKGLTPSTRRPIVSAMRSFYSWAHRHSYMPVDLSPLIIPPRVVESLPNAASLRTIERLLMAPDTTTLQGLRDAAIIAVLAGTGIRVSSLCALNRSSLQIQSVEGDKKAYLRIIAKRQRQMLVPLPRTARVLLHAYLIELSSSGIDCRLRHGDSVMFVSFWNGHCPAEKYYGERRRLGRKSVNGILIKYGRAMGLPEHECHPHAFRHAFGTALHNDNVSPLDMQRLLGHSKVDTTARYAHVGLDRVTKIADRSNPLAKLDNTLVKGLNQIDDLIA